MDHILKPVMDIVHRFDGVRFLSIPLAKNFHSEALPQLWNQYEFSVEGGSGPSRARRDMHANVAGIRRSRRSACGHGDLDSESVAAPRLPVRHGARSDQIDSARELARLGSSPAA